MLVGLTSVFDTGPGLMLTPASHSLLGGVADSNELRLTGVTVRGKHDRSVILWNCDKIGEFLSQ
jgi:hypothetical protein